MRAAFFVYPREPIHAGLQFLPYCARGGACLATILVDCRSMLWKLFQGRTFLNGFFAMFYNIKKNILRLKNIGISLQRQHNFENQSCKQARHIQFMPHFLKIMVGDGAYLHVTDLPEER